VTDPLTRVPAPAVEGAPRRRRVPGWPLLAQYAGFAVLVAVLVATVEWGRLAAQFAETELIRAMFPEIITVALRNTVVYTLTGFALGLLLGLVLALMRISPVAPYRWLAGAYIEFFRGLPALLIVIFVGVAVPLAFPGAELPGGTNGKVALALGLVSAAYLAETVRAGIQAVPTGQWEAASALGFSSTAALRWVVLPQALRLVVPPLTNELVLLFKDSSLVLFLGVTLQERELTKFGRDLASQSANSTPILVAGMCYLLLTVPLGYLARRMEGRDARPRGAP
jgi:polar amino acid transport system permease protein